MSNKQSKSLSFAKSQPHNNWRMIFQLCKFGGGGGRVYLKTVKHITELRYKILHTI